MPATRRRELVAGIAHLCFVLRVQVMCPGRLGHRLGERCHLLVETLGVVVRDLLERARRTAVRGERVFAPQFLRGSPIVERAAESRVDSALAPRARDAHVAAFQLLLDCGVGTFQHPLPLDGLQRGQLTVGWKRGGVHVVEMVPLQTSELRVFREGFGGEPVFRLQWQCTLMRQVKPSASVDARHCCSGATKRQFPNSVNRTT
jgi:hypothetical protein